MRLGEADLFGKPQLRELVAASGPCVSVYLPAARAGAETLQGAVRLRNLLQEARERLTQEGWAGHDVDELLAPEAALVDDRDFWQHQAGGLALFASPELHRSFRVPLDVGERVSVGETFTVRPLLPLVTEDGRFFLLALSQNQVRLFEGTRATVAELDIGDTPSSIAEALAYEDPEAELQVRATGPPNGPGGQPAMFHGHGAGDEIEKDALERFLRLVDRGLWPVLEQHSDQPLVLASVEYYLPMFRSVTRYTRVLEQGVKGNPEGRTPAGLHSRAWELVAPRFRQQVGSALQRYNDAVGTGLTASGVQEVLAAAQAGRVEVAFTRLGLEMSEDDGQVDKAVVETLLTGGVVFAVDPADLSDGDAVSALLRY